MQVLPIHSFAFLEHTFIDQKPIKRCESGDNEGFQEVLDEEVEKLSKKKK